MEEFGFTKGIFTLWEVNKLTDEKVQLVHDDNVIVNNSWLIISGLLNSDSNKFITSLALGDGGVINSELQTPSVNDMELFNELYRKNSIQSVIIETITKPYYITFKFDIEELEANGTAAQIYSEAGLMSSDGTLFSRKTFNEVLKTPEKKFLIDWKLVYSI
jgi:hypothetical protein